MAVLHLAFFTKYSYIVANRFDYSFNLYFSIANVSFQCKVMQSNLFNIKNYELNGMI